MLFYFIGIKGSGMAALAELLIDDGHIVKGLDNENFVFTETSLRNKRIAIENFHEHDFSNVDFFIIGHSFVKHEIMQQIKELGIPYLEYHIFLSKYFDDKNQIAIAGTHGKTTTVGMFYAGLNKELKLSQLRGDGTGVGGIINSHIVYEACEYRDHFLSYHPHTAIITNIDYDHVDYFLTVEDYIASFQKFADSSRTVFILEDDAHLIKHNRKVTFGLNDRADYYFENLNLNTGIHADFYAQGEFICVINLPIFGIHNALHVLSVLAYSHYHHYDISKTLIGLANFTGVKRRLEHKIIDDDVFIDDYAHHPSEIMATISSVRLMYPSHKVIAIFKPDRISRLLNFKDEFIEALSKADESYVLSLYEHLDGKEVSSNILCDGKIKFASEITDIMNETSHENKQVFLFMSSKNLNEWIYGLHELLHRSN